VKRWTPELHPAAMLPITTSAAPRRKRLDGMDELELMAMTRLNTMTQTHDD
jgi:hypothetical protein